MRLSKKIWWILSLTWGLPITLLGLITTVVLLCCGKKPYRNIYGWAFIVGENWGGFNLGPLTVTSKESATRHTLYHEFGHSVQNCYFGPLMPFLVAIPSCIRYWYRELLVRSGRKEYWQLRPYDEAWFEGTATSIGYRYIGL